MKITLLGTGNPIPNTRRSGPSQLVAIDGNFLLIDCGSGVMARLLQAGVDPTLIRYLFLTHHHYDHNIDYAHFVLATWTMRRKHRLEVYGPRETARISKLLFDKVFKTDIEARNFIRVKGRNPDVAVDAQDVDSGFVLRKRNWRLTAFKVDHPQVKHTLGLRLDSRGKSVVFSADTAPCPELINRARGADLLVHEVMDSPRPELHIGHTRPEELGVVASQAGVKRLVLTHLYADSNMRKIIAAIKKTYAGEVIPGRDLMELEV
jgi:ribonuclease BN (tRNA processing enzyme)